MEGSGIHFVALEGLSRKKMAEVLAESMVYIDFGSHPGKDRIPREAALAGNVVIVSTNGSASFFEDLPIPQKYKFRDDQISEISSAIENALLHYDLTVTDFQSYIEIIKKEKEQFFEQVENLFIAQQSRFVAFLRTARYRLVPLNTIIFSAEQVMNFIMVNFSSTVKRNIRKIPFLKK